MPSFQTKLMAEEATERAWTINGEIEVIEELDFGRILRNLNDELGLSYRDEE